MSIHTTAAQIALVLADVDTGTATDNKFRRIEATPVMSVKLADFPQAVIGLMPNANGTIGSRGEQYQYNDYHMAIYVFLGAKTTPLPELYSRAEPWPQAIADKLFLHITLGGNVKFIGGAEKLFDYKAQFIQWGTPEAPEEYWGIVIDLPIYETSGATITA